MSYVGLYDDAGSRNAFYIIKDKKIGRKRVGFKEFGDENEAKFAHRIQSHLAKYSLAPMVYGQVGRIRRGPWIASASSNELSEYGYLTEIARTMPECYDDEYCDGECFQSSCKNGIAIGNIVGDLCDHGLTYTDAHRRNFGYVRRQGKWVPVVIDVGVESFSDWDSDIYGYFEDDYER
mgnify:CR=1 FL=1